MAFHDILYDNAKEGTQAFLAKRPPDFRGKRTGSRS